jgi:hypothetical protein
MRHRVLYEPKDSAEFAAGYRVTSRLSSACSRRRWMSELNTIRASIPGGCKSNHRALSNSRHHRQTSLFSLAVRCPCGALTCDGKGSDVPPKNAWCPLGVHPRPPKYNHCSLFRFHATFRSSDHKRIRLRGFIFTGTKPLNERTTAEDRVDGAGASGVPARTDLPLTDPKIQLMHLRVSAVLCGGAPHFV